MIRTTITFRKPKWVACSRPCTSFAKQNSWILPGSKRLHQLLPIANVWVFLSQRKSQPGERVVLSINHKKTSFPTARSSNSINLHRILLQRRHRMKQIWCRLSGKGPPLIVTLQVRRVSSKRISKVVAKKCRRESCWRWMKDYSWSHRWPFMLTSSKKASSRRRAS